MVYIYRGEFCEAALNNCSFKSWTASPLVDIISFRYVMLQLYFIGSRVGGGDGSDDDDEVNDVVVAVAVAVY